jgi:hypothetical protein
MKTTILLAGYEYINDTDASAPMSTGSKAKAQRLEASFAQWNISVAIRVAIRKER